MAAQYPTPDISSVPYLKLLKLAPEYSVVEKEFKDKGKNYGLLTANTVLMWEFTYDGLSAAQAGTLDAHYADAQGSFEGFNFRDPQTAVLHSDVHYQSYSVDHSKVYSQSRKITLRKSPV